MALQPLLCPMEAVPRCALRVGLFASHSAPAQSTALKRQKSNTQEDTLAHILKQIKTIVEYLASSKDTVRALKGPELSAFVCDFERALSLIVEQLASVNIANVEVCDSFCKALALLPTMLPPDLAGLPPLRRQRMLFSHMYTCRRAVQAI